MKLRRHLACGARIDKQRVHTVMNSAGSAPSEQRTAQFQHDQCFPQSHDTGVKKMAVMSPSLTAKSSRTRTALPTLGTLYALTCCVRNASWVS